MVHIVSSMIFVEIDGKIYHNLKQVERVIQVVLLATDMYMFTMVSILKQAAQS